MLISFRERTRPKPALTATDNDYPRISHSIHSAMTDVRRRRISMGAIACVLSVAAGGRGLLDRTPGETPGPFYPRELPLDDDSDLTQVVGRAGRALGKIGDLDGRLLDINGEPVPYTRIEIWQCDANRRYHHPWD